MDSVLSIGLGYCELNSADTSTVWDRWHRHHSSGFTRMLPGLSSMYVLDLYRQMCREESMLTRRAGKESAASVSKLSETSAMPSSVRRSKAGSASGLNSADRVSSPRARHCSRFNTLHQAARSLSLTISCSEVGSISICVTMGHALQGAPGGMG